VKPIKIYITFWILFGVILFIFGMQYTKPDYTRDVTGNLVLNEVFTMNPNTVSKLECLNDNYGGFDIQINNEGFRDENIIIDERKKIGIFGDSFVHGNCLKDNETLDYQLEKKITDLDYTVYNFGMPGYNLKSTLFVLAQMDEKYDFDYAIVFLTVEDDMVPCDTSCHMRMKQNEPGKYENFIDNLQEYIYLEHLKGEENYFDNFHDQFEYFIIENELHKKTQLIFYIIVNSPNIKSDLETTFQEYGIQYFYEIDCSPKEICHIPKDGHFSAYYHDLLSDELTIIIESNLN